MDTRHMLGFLLATLLLFDSSTVAAATPAQSQRTPESDGQVAALAKKVGALEKQIKELTSKISKLESQQILDRLRYSSAIFDPAEPSFLRVDSTLGAFAVSIENVETFADGIKVRINLGNVTSATYQGATLSLEYGPRNTINFEEADAVKKWGAWRDSLQKKEHKITQSLLPGNWNPVDVVLPNIEQKDFGYLDLSIQTQTISLR